MPRVGKKRSSVNRSASRMRAQSISDVELAAPPYGGPPPVGRRISGAVSIGLMITCSASRSISCRVPVPSPRRVALSAPAAMPRRNASIKAHSSRETDAGGGEHGVAGSRVVERLEHRPGYRDALTGAFISDEDGRRGRAGDEHILRPCLIQPFGGLRQIGQGGAGRAAVSKKFLRTDTQQSDAGAQRGGEWRPSQISNVAVSTASSRSVRWRSLSPDHRGERRAPACARG